MGVRKLMLCLDATNKYILLQLIVTPAVNNLPYYTSYADVTTSTYTPGNSSGTIRNSSTYTIVASPASGTQRIIKQITIVNTDTIPHLIYITYIGASNVSLNSFVVGVNESLIFTEANNWQVISNSANEKQASPSMLSGNFIYPLTPLGSSPSVTIATNTSYAMYMGRCTKRTNNISLRFRVSSVMSSATWAELAVFKGNIKFCGNPSLAFLGYVDASDIFNIASEYTVNVPLSVPAMPGDDLWAVIGNEAGTPTQIGGSYLDPLQGGIFASKASRPSTLQDSVSVWTVESASMSIPLVAAQIGALQTS